LNGPVHPGRDVDTVTKHVIAIDDDIAQINADTELDAPLDRRVMVAHCHVLLHIKAAS
jgi:hypothetical protein